ncbi:MAG TPA: efflux RND transporter permease subunit [Spirochaetota bacterium]|nr:efflux RND transporter permease subunit [Spirochaetota bacterium]
MIRYFIQNRISAYMLVGGMLIFGIIGLTKLPMALMPPTAYPGISVIIEYPGIAPEKIESLITKPTEQIIRTVPGIEKILSLSEEGKSRINITFHLETDVKIAALQVREKIALIRNSFPRAVQEPVVVRYDPSDRPALIASIEGIRGRNATLTQLREYAERHLKPSLQRIDGVAEIVIAGGLQREIHIDADRGLCEARSVSFGELFSAVQSSNVSLPGGILTGDSMEYYLHTPGRYSTIGNITETPINYSEQGALVTIGDIAQVHDSFREREDIARHNGNERVMVYVHKAGNGNILEVCNNAARTITESPLLNTAVVYSQGRYIRQSLNNVLTAGIWGLCIVVLIVVLLYRGAGPAIAISLSIPVSLITVFACMYFAGIPIDVMSLSGLALGAGMVVDSSIIMTESLLGQKDSSETAILGGVKSVATALTASTLTTVIVFLPIVFGNIMTRTMYGGMAFTVSAALLVSLLVSLILVPAVYIDSRKRYGNILSVGNSIFKKKWLTSLRERSQNMETWGTNFYRELLAWSFQRKKKVLIIAGIFGAASLIIIPLVKQEFIDPAGSGELYVYCEFPTGTSLDSTATAVQAAEQYITSSDFAERVSSRIEKWRGTLALTLKDSISSFNERKTVMETLKRELNRILKPVKGFAFVTETNELQSRELGITFFGDDTETLRRIARDSAGKINALPGTSECLLRFRDGRPSYRLGVDRRKTGSSGLSSYEVATFLYNALYGPVVTKFIDDDREIDVRLRYAGSRMKTLDDLLRYAVLTDKGNPVSLGELVSVTEERAATKIWRQDGRRCVTITARLGDITFDDAVLAITETLKTVAMPGDYSYEFDDQYRRTVENRNAVIGLCALSVLFVYMLLGGLFESLVLPCIIILTVPFAFTGVIITLFSTGTSFNIAVYIGMIMLTGIVVNNGIVLVDRINCTMNAVSVGTVSINDVISSTSIEHFRPVMITTISTILGLFPALIKGGDGSHLWRPLSLTVISGLAFSTALTLVLIPVVCSFYYHYSQRRKEQ